MQNIFPNLSFAFEFKYEDGHDYFHILTIRDTDHSCWNWVSKPVKESICFKIALRLIIHLKHSFLLHSRLCERKQKCWIRKCRRCQKCLFLKQATDSSNALCVFPCQQTFLKFLNVNNHFMLISNRKVSIPFVGDAKIPKF